MTYHIQFTPQAIDDLSRLDTAIAKHIIEKIHWLAEHFNQIQPEALTGPFANLFKLRAGNWRVLYTSDPVQHTITIHVIDTAARYTNRNYPTDSHTLQQNSNTS